MSIQDPSNKVIRLNIKREQREGLSRKKTKRTRESKARVISITSGKGGVGKTSIVANLGYAFDKLGKKVLILDADLGLGNLDVLLGLAPKYNLSHVIMGEKTIDEILIDGPGNMKILPAASGIQELTHLTRDQKIQILTQLDLLIDSVDVLFIDTAAGISSNVMDFNVTAQEIVVVVSPEPTSITDAYALMKVLSLKYSEKVCKLLVNMTTHPEEGREVFRQLHLVTDRFLDINIEYLGCILYDQKVTRGVKSQRIVSELFPDTQASRCFKDLARKISNTPPANHPKSGSNLYWRHLVQNHFT
ncbi:MAG: MinD/ParA family protein [Desulfobacterales bacterium]|nr:MinD/ParA family protein [Deltaproteobacteria bacterium]NNL75799.1 MinD/ParA family protein [Desulfobacterales bacterium]